LFLGLNGLLGAAGCLPEDWKLFVLAPLVDCAKIPCSAADCLPLLPTAEMGGITSLTCVLDALAAFPLPTTRLEAVFFPFAVLLSVYPPTKCDQNNPSAICDGVSTLLECRLASSLLGPEV